MKNVIRFWNVYIGSLILLYRWNRNVGLLWARIKSIRQKGGYFDILSSAQRIYKRKNSVYRRLAASIMHQLRKIDPFVPKDFSIAREMYLEYFTIPNHISSSVELNEKLKAGTVYLYQFRFEIPVIGDEIYGSYYINGGGSIGVIRLSNEWTRGDEFTCYLYATPEQIKSYGMDIVKEREKRKVGLMKELNEILLEIEGLKKIYGI